MDIGATRAGVHITVDPRGAVRGAARVNTSLKSIGDRARRLTQLLGILGVGFVANFLRKHSDTWTEVNNKLKIYTGTASQHSLVMTELFDISQRTWTAISGLGGLYNKLALSQKALGASSKELLQFTEGVGKSLALSGADASTARGALLQLGQAMSTGRVYAEEFNSIVEGIPRLAVAIAQAIPEAAGSIGLLKTLIKDGDVGSVELFRAIMSQIPAMNDQFAKLVPTIGNAFTTISNAITKYIGQIATASGISEGISRSLIALAGNFELMGGAVGVATTALIIHFAAMQVTKLIALGAATRAATGATRLQTIGLGLYTVAAKVAQKATAFLTVTMLANPFVAMATAVSTAVSFLVIFGNSITPIEGSLASLQDLAVSTMWYIGNGFKMVGEIIYEWILKPWVELFNTMTSGLSTLGVHVGAFNEILSSIGGWIVSLVRDAYTNINKFIGVFVGSYRAIMAAWGNFPYAFSDLIIQALNATIGYVNEWTRWFAESMNSALPESLQIPLDFGEIDLFENKFKGAADVMKEAFSDALSVDYLAGGLDLVVRKVKEAGAQILEDAEERHRLRIQRRDEDLAFSHDVLPIVPLAPYDPNAGKAGPKITFEGVLADLERNIELQKLSNAERAVAIAQFEVIDQFTKAKVALTNDQAQILRDKATELHFSELGAAATDKFASASNKLNEEVHEFNELRSRGLITEQVYQNALQKTYQAYDIIAGNMDSLRAKIAEASAGWADTMTDTFVDAARTGKLSFKSLADSVLADLARMAFKASVVQPIFNALGSAFNIPNFGGARAAGGPVAGGTAYLVGEKGPELFTPGTNGYITPNRSGSGANAGGGTNVKVSVYNNAPGAKAEAIASDDGNGGFNLDILVEAVTARQSDDIDRGKGLTDTIQRNFGVGRNGTLA